LEISSVSEFVVKGFPNEGSSTQRRTCARI
jgi:hypothetical protein